MRAVTPREALYGWGDHYFDASMGSPLNAARDAVAATLRARSHGVRASKGAHTRRVMSVAESRDAVEC